MASRSSIERAKTPCPECGGPKEARARTCYGCRFGKWPDKIWEKIVPNHCDCWMWVGLLDKDGYGHLYNPITKQNQRTHRIVWELLTGEIVPPDLTIDHLCRVHACVNPDHCQVVPVPTNVLRGYGFVAQNARKTHCPYGHPLSGPNLRVTKARNGLTARRCRTCLTERERRRPDRRPGARKVHAA